MLFLTKYEAECEEPGIMRVRCRFLVGATGAISSTSYQSPHITGVTRASAGAYKFVFDSFFFAAPTLPGGTAPSPLTDCNPQVVGSVTTTDGTVGHVSVDNMLNGDASGVPYVTVAFTAGADGTAADVKSGNEVQVTFFLKAHA